MSSPTIAVCMSTYNGEKFVAEQIDSILAQEGVMPLLFIRDDNSTDSTREILESYADNHENVIFVNRGERQNLGVKRSFLTLLKWVYENYPDIQYFAFSDQDDVWKKEKLSVAVAKLDAAVDELDRGKLYYSKKTIVDENLKFICEEHQRFMQYHGDFIESLGQSPAFGCTMVFDRRLAGYVVRRIPDLDWFHDCWLYRIAKCIGTAFVFDEDSYIQYRQHANNVDGWKDGKFLCHYLKRLFQPDFYHSAHGIQNKLREIYENYQSEVDSFRYAQVVRDVLCYNRNLAATLRLLSNREAWRRDWRGYLYWGARILLHKL